MSQKRTMLSLPAVSRVLPSALKPTAYTSSVWSIDAPLSLWLATSQNLTRLSSQAVAISLPSGLNIPPCTTSGWSSTASRLTACGGVDFGLCSSTNPTVAPTSSSTTARATRILKVRARSARLIPCGGVGSTGGPTCCGSGGRGWVAGTGGHGGACAGNRSADTGGPEAGGTE